MKPHGLYLKRLVAEIAPAVVGGIVHGVRSDLGRNAIVLLLDTSHGKRLLHFGPRPPAQPLVFARKRGELPNADDFSPVEIFNRLRNRRLGDFDMPQADRVIVLSFDEPPERDKPPLNLQIRYTGSAANMILIDASSSIVLETLWQTQTVKIGEPCPDFPTPGMPDLSTLEFPQFAKIVRDTKAVEDGGFWKSTFWGIDIRIAEAITERVRSVPKERGSNEWTIWQIFQAAKSVVRDVVDPNTRAGLMDDSTSGRRFALPFRPSGIPDKHWEDTASFAGAVLQEASGMAIDQVRSRIRSGLERWLKAEIAHIKKRVDVAQKAIDAGADAERFGRLGDLLTAHFHLLKRGMTSIELNALTEVETEPHVITVKLDPKLSPRENVNQYYRKRRKSEAAAETAQAQMKELQPRYDELANLLRDIESVSDGEDLPVSIIQRAKAMGYVHAESTSETAPNKPRFVQRRLPYREFHIDDWSILVGKSNRDNDILTLKHAHKEDLFLHAQQCAGSHVIVRQWSQKTEIPEDIVIKAAEIAAYFSKARTSGKVPVLVAKVKHVRKPRKAPPGKVTVERERSLMVVPTPPPGYHDS